MFFPIVGIVHMVLPYGIAIWLCHIETVEKVEKVMQQAHIQPFWMILGSYIIKKYKEIGSNSPGGSNIVFFWILKRIETLRFIIF